MSEWLLIIVLMSGGGGLNTPKTDIAMQYFSSRELCVSAAKEAENISRGYKTSFEYKCLKQESGKWIEGQKK